MHTTRSSILIHINPHCPQLGPRMLDLAHQFLVRFGYVIERHDAVAESSEEVCAKSYEGPERQLDGGHCQ